MPTKIGLTDYNTLVSAPLPPATATYTVISHQFVIDTVRKELAANGFEIQSEEYRATSGANVAVGTFKIIYGNDPDLNLMYTFSNSYDKSLRFRAAIGACINNNNSFIISQTDNWLRKHTGTADTETEELVKGHIEKASEYFDSLVVDKEAMKEVTVSKTEFGSLIGELFINGFLGLDQMSVIKKEYDKPSFAYTTPADNLWTLYNHILFALSTTHPSKWMANHVAAHMYLVAKFHLNIIQFDDEEAVEESPKNQIDYLEGEQPENNNTENEQTDMFAELDPVEEAPVTEEVTEEAPATEEHESPNMEELGQNVFAFDEANEEENEEVTEEVSEEVQEIVNKAVENPSNDTGEEIVEGADELIGEAEEVYFDCADYEGVNVGDTIEEENVYYDLIRKENIEGDDYFIGVAIAANDEETLDDHQVEDALEEVTEETQEEAFSPVDHARQARAAVSIEELSDEDLLDQYGHMNAEEINSAINEEAAVYHSEGVATPDTNEVNEDVVNEEYNDDVDAVLEQLDAKSDPLIPAIKSQLNDLYGYEPEFTYEVSGMQLNITLETGESVCLSKAYIESLI